MNETLEILWINQERKLKKKPNAFDFIVTNDEIEIDRIELRRW